MVSSCGSIMHPIGFMQLHKLHLQLQGSICIFVSINIPEIIILSVYGFVSFTVRWDHSRLCGAGHHGWCSQRCYFKLFDRVLSCKVCLHLICGLKNNYGDFSQVVKMPFSKDRPGSHLLAFITLLICSSTVRHNFFLTLCGLFCIQIMYALNPWVWQYQEEL